MSDRNQIMLALPQYARVEKAAVLQAARMFHYSNAVREDPLKCCTVICRLLQLLQNNNTGQILSRTEASEVFFGVTKLFMSDGAALRRLVYLFLKEVAETCNPDDMIMVTSCLTKDVFCDVVLFRSNALRVLARIVDAETFREQTHLQNVFRRAIGERHSRRMSQSSLVASCGLLSASPAHAEIVKTWTKETEAAVRNPTCPMAQFQALQLLLQQVRGQALTTKLGVLQLPIQSTLSFLLILRFTGELVREIENGNSLLVAAYDELLTTAMDPIHDDDMVAYEAARLICLLTPDCFKSCQLLPALVTFRRPIDRQYGRQAWLG